MTKIRSLMKKTVLVKEDDEIVSLAKTLKRHNLTGVPVVNSKKVVTGFVSERDIVAAVPKKNFLSLKVKNIMKKKVISVKPEDPIVTATKIFSGSKIRLLPVIKAGKVMGIITRNDCIEHMLRG